MAAQHKVCFGTGLDRHQGQLVEMRPLGVSEAGIGELRKRLPAPQPERLAQHGRRRSHLALLEQVPPIGDQPLELTGVHIVRTDTEGVAGFAGDDRRRSEGAA